MHGYPICWAQSNDEWHPYLPAMFSFSYPIFRGMSTDPLIIHDKSGYRLTDEEISLWRNVEYVIWTSALALQNGLCFPLEQQVPFPPSKYGYAQRHSQERFARKCALKSLHAFQRLLAYCSYLLIKPRSVSKLTCKIILCPSHLSVDPLVTFLYNNAPLITQTVYLPT